MPSFGRDGRKPHVKSNIRAKLANSGSGSRKKFFSKLNQQKIRKKAGHKVRDDNPVDVVGIGYGTFADAAHMLISCYI